MSYDYACFISYKRPPKPVYPSGVVPRKPGKNLWLLLAEKFEEQLDAFLETRIRVFRDNLLEPGSDYPRYLKESMPQRLYGSLGCPPILRKQVVLRRVGGNGVF